VLLSARCAGCDAAGPSPCPTCRARLRPPAPEVDPPGLEGLVAVLRYDGPARALVARVKYRNQRQALAWMADALAAAVAERLAATPATPATPAGAAGGRRRIPGVLVTWAPTTGAHRRARGFDHGELLARAVARRLGAPCRSLLRRRPGPAQTGRAAAERRAGAPSFVTRGRVPPGALVVVVDDVVTTGATLRAATAALRSAGARSVLPAAVARTPARAGPAVGGPPGDRDQGPGVVPRGRL
jgi:predicted amidophosphoribosyltransferase